MPIHLPPLSRRRFLGSVATGLPALNTGWEYRCFILDDGALTRGFLRAELQSDL